LETPINMKKTYLILVLLIIAQSSISQTLDDRGKRLDSLINAYADLNLFNGTILIAQDNKILLEKGYGYADFEWNSKNNSNTKMMLASFSKHFTANCILQLYQNEQLDLNDEVQKHLPFFKDSDIGTLTIHQLLSHTSGIQRDIYELAEESQVHQIELDVFKKLRNSELRFIPGARYSYSNAGYFLLAKIIERTTDVSFAESLDSLIFRPVGMKNSGYFNKYKITPNIARGHNVMFEERIKATMSDPSVIMGASGIYSTINDIFEYEKSYQNNLLLTKESKRLMETPVTKKYGYGWNSNLVGKDKEGENIYLNFHNGDASGFATQYLRYGPDRFTVIMLSNQDKLPRSELFNQIVNVVNGGNPMPINTSVYDLVYRTAVDEGIDNAMQIADSLKSNGINYPNAIRVNFLANMFLKVDRIEDAKTLNGLIIRMYPKDHIGYSALGLILKSEGNLIEAKTTFEKILEFDPKNPYAKKFLKELEN